MGDSNISQLLLAIYNRLQAHFGHQNWWPGDRPLEVMIGAVLTQNTAWTNVEKAILNLRSNGLLNLNHLLELSASQLSEFIRPSRYHRQKAKRLLSLLQWLNGRCAGEFRWLNAIPTEILRGELLAIKGIGPETADDILLYTLNRPVYVIDAYTRRAGGRIGLNPRENSYAGWQNLFMEALPPDPALFNDYHAQWVALGKNYCRTQPRCPGCPLNDICSYCQGRPTGGPIN